MKHHASLEARLRADAEAVRETAAPDLSSGVLSRIGDLAQEAPRRSWSPRLVPLHVVAAAAAVALVASLWVVASRPELTGAPDIPAEPTDVVALSRDLLNPPLLARVTAVDDPLLAEPRNLWSDTSRAAESMAPLLRLPLRLRTDKD